MTPEERRAYNKAYYEANKEAIAAGMKAYREANKEAIAAKHKAYCEANKEALAARQKAYREANKEAIAARLKAYREANKEALAERARAHSKAYYEANKEAASARDAKRRAATRGGIPDFLRDCPCERRRIAGIYKMRNLFTEITGVEHHVDHMWPLSKGGPHWSGNLQIIPAQDNLSKSASVCKETKKTIRESLKWAKENYCDTTNDQGGKAALEGT